MGRYRADVSIPRSRRTGERADAAFGCRGARRRSDSRQPAQHAAGVDRLLGVARLSVKNVLLIGAFACGLGRSCFRCAGCTRLNRLRTGEGEWARLAAAGAIGCALAMVFPLTGKKWGRHACLRSAFWRGVRSGRRPPARLSSLSMDRKRSRARPRPAFCSWVAVRTRWSCSASYLRTRTKITNVIRVCRLRAARGARR